MALSNSIFNARRALQSLLLVLLVAGAAWGVCAVGPMVALADEVDSLLAGGNYVEGEVVVGFAVGDGQILPQSEAYSVEPIMEVGASALQGEGVLLPQASDGVMLSLVSSDTLSTEELLRLLADDSRVAFAEPNYTCTLPSIASAGMSSQTDTSSIGDLTPLQWGNWADERTMRAVATADNPSINVPAFGSDQRGANMDRQIVVAVLDTGIDYTNPELQNVLYHFTDTEQEALGCWEWGYNAVGRGHNGNVRDDDSIAMGHGTHTAGILGAEWDGKGTSGVASDVKIVAIEIANGEGVESLADSLYAFNFVNRFNEQAPEDERIRVTSNSWSDILSTRALDAVLRELGERWGTVSVFSAGNDSKNNDYYEKTVSTLSDNPYVVVVANTDASDHLCESSEYGEATVDLAAPGTIILSALPWSSAKYLADGSRDTNLVYVGFDGQEEPTVSVSQLYTQQEPGQSEIPLYQDNTVVCEGIAAPTDEAHFVGERSLKVEIDPAYVVGTQSWTGSVLYDIQLDIDLTGTDIAGRIEGVENLQLGLSLSSEAGGSCYGLYASSNVALIDMGEGATRSTVAVCGSSDAGTGSRWAIANYEITSDIESRTNVPATAPVDNHLVLKLRMQLPEGCTTFYIDSLGLGTQVIPYGFATGTSMACPAVAGAAAVFASQGETGTALASLVRSKVRVPAAGALPVRSGGVFDFNAVGSPDGGEEQPLAPAITDVAVEGSTVTITGSNFGTTEGSVALSRYVVAKELEGVGSHVTSWADDRVTLELEGSFQGILCAVLTNKAGMHDTRYHFVSKGETVFEQDLDFDTSVADVFVYGDGQGDWETKGPLVGLGCKLYYLPVNEGYRDSEPATKRLLCYDLKKQTWEILAELPEWLQGVSAVMYEGKLVVEGATMYLLDTGEPTTKFPEGQQAEERVYVYDPTDGTWTQASSEGMRLGQSIANDDGQLLLAGGEMPDPDDPYSSWKAQPAPVYAYSLTSGVGDVLCQMPEAPFIAPMNPELATKNGTILLYNAAASTLVRIQDGTASVLEGALPAFFYAKEGEPVSSGWGEVAAYPRRAVLAPVSEGFVLVGPPAADGSSDTYLLRDNEEKFEPYEKRSSDDRVFSQAACTYRGRLFVIGSSLFEPEKRVFRATSMNVPEYAGDLPCEDDPTPDPEPTPTPTPTPTPAPSGSGQSGTSASTSQTARKTLPKTGEEPALALACAVAGALLVAQGYGARYRLRHTEREERLLGRGGP